MPLAGGLPARRTGGRPRPIDAFGRRELGDEHLAQLDPDAGLLPGAEMVQAGNATAAAELRGQSAPGDAAREDDEDAGEGLARFQGLAPREAPATRLVRWQQRLDTLPQLIAQELLSAG